MFKIDFYKTAVVVVILLISVIYLDYRDTNRYLPSQVSKHVVIDTKTGDVYFYTANGSKKIGIKK